MSGTIGQYNKVGLQNLEGEVRFKQDSQELTNKGSLSQKIATFFSNIGNAIAGIFGKGTDEVSLQTDQSRRQSEALTGFKEALGDKYGDTIRDWALEAGKLDGKDGGPIKFTGLSIKQALDEANSRMETRQERLNDFARNWQLHVSIPESLVNEYTRTVEKEVPDPDRGGYGDHHEYTKTVYEQETYKGISDRVNKQMRDQVEERLRTESNSGRTYLDDDRIKQIISEELGKIKT